MPWLPAARSAWPPPTIWSSVHFQERITGDAIVFDYRLRPGPAVTRNAIRLLKLMGFDERITSAAESRAAAFEKTGAWGM